MKSSFFAYCFKNIVKAKCKTAFIKLINDYICHIFLKLGIKKIKRSSNIYTFKKMKDGIGYVGLHMLYRPSEYVFLLC